MDGRGRFRFSVRSFAPDNRCCSPSPIHPYPGNGRGYVYSPRCMPFSRLADVDPPSRANRANKARSSRENTAARRKPPHNRRDERARCVAQRTPRAISIATLRKANGAQVGDAAAAAPAGTVADGAAVAEAAAACRAGCQAAPRADNSRAGGRCLRSGRRTRALTLGGDCEAEAEGEGEEQGGRREGGLVERAAAQ